MNLLFVVFIHGFNISNKVYSGEISKIDDLTKILEINPQHIKALLTRADIFVIQNKLEDACVDYKKAEALGDIVALSKRIFNCK